jgi:2-polyprenyl-6-methoxyphenol hydroxylase-like FAD-dependent oxidoreductase
MKPFDVCVSGAGVVGQSLALCLAQQGLRVALVAQEPGLDVADKPMTPDVRAFALNPASQALLASIKVWDALPQGAATPVHEMSIRGDDPHAHLSFSAWQQNVTQLAWITDAAALTQALADALRYSPHVSMVPQPVKAALWVLSEGKQSQARDDLGVHFEAYDTGQWALAARLNCSEPHQQTAHQWFGSPDILALLPFDLPQAKYSFALVWSMPKEKAQGYLRMPRAAFETALIHATGGACGQLTLGSELAAWPLLQGLAKPWSGPGWALVGDCAHVVHPLAGQGLNLGLADVAALSQVLAERESWRDLGDAKLLRRYARMRLGSTQAMGHVTNGLLQLFASDNLAVRRLRNQGLSWLNRLPPIKRLLTARALHS